jgi:hypothetical protein
VARRLEEGQWGWYYRAALRTVIQACGRIIRAPDDHGATYLADSSLLDLFERARTDMPDWFAAQVDRMTEPDLPAYAPAAALGDESGDGGSKNRGRNRSRRRRSSRRDADETHPLSDVWDS